MQQEASLKKRLRLPRRCWLLALYPVAWMLIFFAQHSQGFAEQIFALGFYKAVSQGISAVTGALPFSLLEAGILAAVILLFVLLFFLIRKVIKAKGSRWRIIGKAALNLACAVGVGVFLFVILCGINYHRLPFSAYSGLEIQPAHIEQLYDLCTELAEEANSLRAQITQEDEAGVTKVFTDGYWPVAQQAREALECLAREYEILGGSYSAPKPVFFSGLMSYTEITGVYCPFTMEANINVACTEYTIPATMCHELSHLRGFMREDEANFIAFLACRGSKNLLFEYSGTMLALVHAGNQLYAKDAALYQELQNQYSEGVARDLNADYWYWQQFEDKVISTVSTKVNDTYLKVNHQDDGVQSYGRMVDLLLADYRQRHGID